MCTSAMLVSTLIIKPDKRLLLDELFNFRGLTLKSQNRLFNIIFQNFKGIDLKFDLSSKLEFKREYEPIAFFWYFSSFDFEFYIFKKTISQEQCNFDFFSKNFVFMKKIKFLLLQKNVIYSTKTCPLIFHDTIIQLLNIDGLMSSFVRKNILAFQNVSQINKIESLILQLEIRVFHYDLSNELLNKNIFEKLHALDISGSLNSIQPDLFKSFKQLKNLRFRTQNARGLLTINNNWINYLNYDIYVRNVKLEDWLNEALMLTIFQTFSNVTYYSYPDEDFCYFKAFPHERLVWPQLKPNLKSACSCTELYLIQFSYSVGEEFNLAECGFMKRLDKCKISGINKNKALSSVYWYMLDWQELSKYSYLSFVLYVNPILSFFCIFVNAITIMVFSHPKIKENIKHFYTYLKAYLFSNLMLVSVHLLELTIECTYEDYFCSMKNTMNTEYFKSMFLTLVKNSLVTFANISYTAFVAIRYIKITNTKNVKFKKFEKLSLKFYLIFAVLFSVLINIYIIFEYSIQFRDAQMFRGSIHLEANQPIDYFKVNLNENEHLILNIFQYLKIFFSDLLFFVSSIVFDVILIIFLKKNSKKIQPVTANLANQNQNGKRESSKRRLTAIIILNGLNFLVLRLPQNLMDFYGLIVSVNLENDNTISYEPNLTLFFVCRLFRFCDSLKAMFYALYLLSFLTQFFIFYKLDNNFNNGFKVLKEEFKIKIKNN